MENFAPTRSTTLKRRAERGSYDRALVNAILDEGLVCHVGFVDEAQPFVIPTSYARVGECLYLHGSVASRMLKGLQTGIRVCVTVTLLDGIVLARSAKRHSMNYRSVVILGTATEVLVEEEKRAALDALIEHVVPNRLAEIRKPSQHEINATLVLSIPLLEASAKIRRGPPVDSEEDQSTHCWAGELPLRLTPGIPIPDPRLAADIATPAALLNYCRGT